MMCKNSKLLYNWYKLWCWVRNLLLINHSIRSLLKRQRIKHLIRKMLLFLKNKF